VYVLVQLARQFSFYPSPCSVYDSIYVYIGEEMQRSCNFYRVCNVYRHFFYMIRRSDLLIYSIIYFKFIGITFEHPNIHVSKYIQIIHL